MNLRVDCDAKGVPRALILGATRLQIANVLEQAGEDSTRRYRVQVLDGRVFTLRLDLAAGRWELVRVNSHHRAT